MYAAAGMGQAFASSFFSNIEYMESRHLRMIVRLVLSSAVRSTPIEYRRDFLFPILGSALPHLHYRLSEAWAHPVAKEAVADSRKSGNGNDSDLFDSEILNARSLVELARDDLGNLNEDQLLNIKKLTSKDKSNLEHMDDERFEIHTAMMKNQFWKDRNKEFVNIGCKHIIIMH